MNSEMFSILERTKLTFVTGPRAVVVMQFYILLAVETVTCSIAKRNHNQVILESLVRFSVRSRDFLESL